MIFTTSCAACHEPGDTLCRRCRFSLATVATPPTAMLPHGTMAHAALPFDGVVRDIVLALKYRNARTTVRALAHSMVRRLGLSAQQFDLVTWAPTSAARAQRRGFDQAEFLARAVAAELGLPCRRLLFRAHSAPQTGLDRQQRLNGPAFRSRTASAQVRVLLVDDVLTTGATLDYATARLRDAGFTSVTPVALATVAAPTRSGFGGTRPQHRPSPRQPVGSLGGPPVRLAG
jgi:predicted amidophosphoribosyltransferase